MRFSTLFSGLLAAVGLAAASPTAAPRALDGSFSYLPDETPISFKYSVPTANAKNWIGIYPTTGGPDEQQKVNPSITWAYTPNAEGTVQISTSGLVGGQQYKAYFLANDEYKWLAEPLTFTMPFAESKDPFEFLVSNFTTQNARVGQAFSASIAGLLAGVSDPSKVTYEKSSGAEWAEVSAEGAIAGKPTAAGTSQVTVKATLNGKSSTLDVTIKVRREEQGLVSSLHVLTYNLWMGGANVNDYHRKQVRFLAQGNYDVIGFQESTGEHATRLAKALGWYSWQGQDVGTISRYPITEVYSIPGSYAGGVRIALDGDKQQINVWNDHLGYTPYGPYDFCFDKMTVERVLEREAQSNRTPQIIKTMELMKSALAGADKVPVILLGDFNAPSHLDFTEATRERNCGYANVPWPTSVEPTNAGMVDSFRVIHPDPLAVPGITWSPIYLTNNGRKEPLDRIDFIYHKGNMTVVDSETLVVGKPTAQPNHKDNEWTSDHAAVRTLFQWPVGGQPCKPRKA